MVGIMSALDLPAPLADTLPQWPPGVYCDWRSTDAEILLQWFAEPGEGGAIPGRVRIAVPDHSGGCAQRRAVQRGIPLAQSERQGAGDRGWGRARLRQQRDSAVFGGENRPLFAVQYATGARRSAFLADVRGQRRGPLLGSGSAFQAFCTAGTRLCGGSLSVRSAPALWDSGCAVEFAHLSAGGDLHHRGYGGVGLGANDPVHRGGYGLERMAQFAALVRSDQRKTGGNQGERVEGALHLQDGYGCRGAAHHVPPHGNRPGTIASTPIAPRLACAQKVRCSICLQPQLLFKQRQLVGIPCARGLFQPRRRGACRLGKYIGARTLE